MGKCNECGCKSKTKGYWMPLFENERVSARSKMADSLSDLASLYLEECHVSGDSMIALDHSLESHQKCMNGSLYIADLMAGFAEKMIKENTRFSERVRDCC